MELMEGKNILVIGAGPSGLTAALAFARKQVFVTIVEKRKEPSNLSRAVGIMPESLRKLGKNVSKAISEESMPFMQINMHVGEERVLNLDFSDKVDPSEVLSGLPQDRTEEIIAKELANLGVDIQYATAVTAITTTDQYASVTFNDETESQTFDWVIACDGVNSVTRQQLGIEYNGFDLDNPWSIADVELNGQTYNYAANNVWMKLGKNYDAVVSLPIGQNRIRLISTSLDCIETIPFELDIAKIHRKGTFKVSVRQANTYKKGRVLLAGDSAHCHSPVGGKGMNLGIADAVAAVEAILQGKTNQYSNERHVIGAAVLKDSEAMRKMIMNKSPILKLLIKTFFGLVNKLSFIQTIAIKRISQL